MSIFYVLNIQQMIDVRQMSCSISRQNNEQEYLSSGSVRYINPVMCDKGLMIKPMFWGVSC